MSAAPFPPCDDAGHRRTSVVAASFRRLGKHSLPVVGDALPNRLHGRIGASFGELIQLLIRSPLGERLSLFKPNGNPVPPSVEERGRPQRGGDRCECRIERFPLRGRGSCRRFVALEAVPFVEPFGEPVPPASGLGGALFGPVMLCPVLFCSVERRFAGIIPESAGVPADFPSDTGAVLFDRAIGWSALSWLFSGAKQRAGGSRMATMDWGQLTLDERLVVE